MASLGIDYSSSEDEAVSAGGSAPTSSYATSSSSAAPSTSTSSASTATSSLTQLTGRKRAREDGVAITSSSKAVNSGLEEAVIKRTARRATGALFDLQRTKFAKLATSTGEEQDAGQSIASFVRSGSGESAQVSSEIASAAPRLPGTQTAADDAAERSSEADAVAVQARMSGEEGADEHDADAASSAIAASSSAAAASHYPSASYPYPAYPPVPPPGPGAHWPQGYYPPPYPPYGYYPPYPYPPGAHVPVDGGAGGQQSAMPPPTASAKYLDKHMRRDLGISADGTFSHEYAAAVQSSMVLADGGGPSVVSLSARDVRGVWDVSAATAAATASASKSQAPAIKARVWSASAGEAVSAGDASRLHKKKHQIHALAAAAQASSAQLSEQRASGQRTKAQVYAKYGW